jgi:hypothetical protein
MNKKVFISIVVTFAIIFFVLMFFFISNHEADIVPIESRAIPTSTNQTTTPTIIPPELKTQWAYYRQTQQAEAVAASATWRTINFQTSESNSLIPSSTPTPLTNMEKTQTAAVMLRTYDPQQDYPQMVQYDPEWILSLKLIGELTGNGILIEGEDTPLYIHTYNGKHQNYYELNFEYWYEERYDSYISVWSGVSRIEPGKGVVWVDFSSHIDPYSQFVIVETADLTGSLKIIGAQEERLILQSPNRRNLYFDVPSVKFVNSMEETLPTATQVPTPTYSVPTSTWQDDAPDEPWMVNYQYSQTDVDLHYFINSSSDFDWFLFEILVPGEISVSLSNYPGNCGIRLVKINYPGNDLVKIEDRRFLGTIIGEDISPGNGKKQLVVSDAQPSDYLVRVWCPDGSYSLEDPYTLRINIPTPLRVTPILECVAMSPDGSFIAHFGYDNPNQYVVLVDADTSNNFYPMPVFRTGQPEAFSPGRIYDFFSVLFDGNDLTWTLDGTSITANRDSPRCP